MAPIRVAMIGLSASAATSWASDAHLPYLLSARGRQKFAIVALCNSSVEAARRAIETYKLPSETRAYGDPTALASDPDVELVVCCTRVDLHHQTTMPSVEAGKDVFIEWPLAQDAARARELAAAARASGSRTLVGLQGRLSPAVVKLRQLLDSGRIGKVLSSEVRAAGGSLDRLVLSSQLEYFTDRRVGGNIITIGFGHCETSFLSAIGTTLTIPVFDQVQHVLGSVAEARALLQLQRPEVPLRDPSTRETVGTAHSDVPDLVLATGSVASGASVLVRFRRGQPFPGDAGLVWTVNGERGEVRLRAQGGPTLQANAYAEPVTLELHDYAADTVQEVGWEWEEWQAELPVRGRSVAMLYERFAQGSDGVDNDQGTPSFEDAVERHAQLEKLLESWSEPRF